MDKDIIELIPVEGHNQLGRDPNSNAIVNTDLTAYESYKKARAEAKRKATEMEDLKGEVAELKSLVKRLIEKEDK
nr:hypothetical protein [uncultured Mediterranean phage uvMED]BAR31234.1 hypothetical protein [uncultured Mediterranean phage uvMED]|tara:strand:+ start:25939 stop:26163 length:225 start_codon:yes stop_codon:yes gene_type:complete